MWSSTLVEADLLKDILLSYKTTIRILHYISSLTYTVGNLISVKKQVEKGLEVHFKGKLCTGS